eukprot:TRINITY_DN17671_c0_g1_i1.p4 TRINITY_DN17671_c0_g1~~TRINITY_DN17671_c0_g1_i1.p4  ORF type:complete len:103 (+),score=5.22 TRINITY_DN17671_c0_g1_i1:331-639(+)
MPSVIFSLKRHINYKPFTTNEKKVTNKKTNTKKNNNLLKKIYIYACSQKAKDPQTPFNLKAHTKKNATYKQIIQLKKLKRSTKPLRFKSTHKKNSTYMQKYN